MLSDEFKAVMVDTISKYKTLPLCLSGGVDSSNILFAFLTIGVKPQCYTFQYGDYESLDVKMAKSITAHFNCPHTIVKVPSDFDTMVKDIKRTIKMLDGVTTKTHIQCSIPMIYLAEKLKNDGYSKALVGIQADDLLGTFKKACIQYSKGGESAFLQSRLDDIAKPDSSASIKKVASIIGVDLIDIYETKEVADVLLKATYKEVHKPFQKWVVVNAFSEFWNQGTWYRKNASYQVVSGIRESHDRLLDSPYNIRNAKQVIAIYNDMRDGKV